MEPSEQRDVTRLQELAKLLDPTSGAPIGDTFIAATILFELLENGFAIHLSEEAMLGFRAIASRAEPTTELFAIPPKLHHELTDIEFIQLVRIEMAIHELCYACEMVQIAADKTSGASSPTIFYLNSIYHYVSSLFLIDTSKSTHKDLPMGGTVIRALYPLGLSEYLKPIKEVLDEPFGDSTFGGAILNLRHSDLVHGDFSPERVEYLIRQTQWRNPKQIERFSYLIWKLFHRLIILHLILLSLIASTKKDVSVVMLHYLLTKSIS